VSFSEELEITAATTPHFVLIGSTWDFVVTIDGEGRPTVAPVTAHLLRIAERNGLSYLVIADPARGFRLATLGGESATTPSGLPREVVGLPAYQRVDPAAGAVRITPADVATMIAAITSGEALGGLVVVDAARLIVDVRSLNENEHALFTVASATARGSLPRAGADGRQVFSPVYWLCRSEYELPAWYVSDPCVRTVSIPAPTHHQRQVVAEQTVPGSGQDIAEATDAMSTRDLLAISTLVQHGSTVGDATTHVRLGVVDDPWRDAGLQTRLTAGDRTLMAQVLGQERAVQQAWAAITRSISGLSGAHRPSSGRRPRIVLWLNGPTGTGKTELAKAIARLIFGQGAEPIRFDMSGYKTEETGQRLIGAPPGYVGYEAGGELTNAVRARPFSVILFDEIEKAHPLILDKFLQILDEGQLDDGLGRRVYFDQSVIIFTSNLGIYEEHIGPDGRPRRVQVVEPSMTYDEISSKVREVVERHFVEVLGRAELLNRLGDNVVVFDFLRPEHAPKIFDRMIGHVVDAVARRHDARLEIEPQARAALQGACCDDLAFGGRGIGNKIESLFLNPLGLWMYQRIQDPPQNIRVTGWSGGAYPAVEVADA
jgi:ATP-dependent Clp protease ATP-binding subunit ClpB